MRHIVIGTAGHIDHGKTTLVKALTGIDTDRLKEEKERGISIDLGFAHAALGEDLRAAFIDVPGHEKFVRNMLAGSTGVDVLLLVVDAREGVQPQTREHFEISRLLGIRRGVVAITKADLASPEDARAQLEEFLRGSFLEGAPRIAVSAVTGSGLDELKAALTMAAGDSKQSSGFARLPIDRSFSVKGHGAVVTGTLASGKISRGEELELFPPATRVRVRSVEVHGQQVGDARAGERTALNLAGIDAKEMRRGMTLASPGRLRLTSQVDVMLELLRAAPPLKHRAPVHFHAGTAEAIAEVRLLESLDPMKPGSAAAVRLELREPMLLLPGDRFILRSFSPVTTIAGGMIGSTWAPPSKRAELAARTRALAGADLAGQLSRFVEESEHGLSLDDAVARTGRTLEEIHMASTVTGGWLVNPQWRERKAREVADALRAYHAAEPLRPGMSREALRAQVGAPAHLFSALLQGVVSEGELVRLESHRVKLDSAQEKERARLEAVFCDAGLAIPSIQEALAKSEIPAAKARTILEGLLKSGRLVRVNQELAIHADAAAKLREMLASRKGVKFSVPEFKDWTGVSRKYAIPLLEWLDRQRLTRREGEVRVIL